MSVKLVIQKTFKDTKKVAKVILNDNGKILLLLRKPNQAHPNKWDLPGGHLVEGESWRVGATREVKEETNLTVGELQFVTGTARKRFYITSDWEGSIFPTPELPEHDDLIWIEHKKAEQLSNLGDIYRDVIRRAFACDGLD